ncbi:MAG: DegT/DnrJ/EryC1/StrS family aminotransferase [Nanoarchaeota archaeon]
MIPVCEPSLIGNELEYVTDCVKTNWISSNGAYIERFEEQFSRFCNVKHGVSCCNGTAAIYLALAAAGIGPGDEVIIPSFTMIASCNAIIYTGAKPVLVDSDPETWCIDPTKIKEKVTKRTKAIMPVHIYGHPADMDPINDIAEDHNLLVIEDAAEAHGAEYKGRRCGSLGGMAAFSFYANKIITCGEGGMVVTDNEEFAEKMRKLRNHAFGKPRFIHHELGFNFRITNIQAAIGCAQMENADKLVEMRIRNAKLYNELLKDVEGVELPPELPWAKNVYWMYGILLNKRFGITKDEAMAALEKQGVETRSFFYGMNLQPVYHGKDPRFPDVSGSYPVSDDLGKRGLYLPSGSTLTKGQIGEVVEAVRRIRKI